MNDPIVITAASRTPMGGFQGELSNVKSTDLGAAAIKAALTESQISADQVDEVIMGCVLPAGLGQAPARQAAIVGGLPESTPCTTVNKMCGSGMKTTMMGYDQLMAGNGDYVVTGGMESMTNAPYVLPRARDGYRLGHAEVKDHMFLDGLEDAYDKGQLMGVFAEDCAEKFQFTREMQDTYALQSLENALNAEKNGYFTKEITPVTVKTRKGSVEISTDEQPSNARPDKIPQLKPAFIKDGTVTPANASSISDGAAALMLCRESTAARDNITPRAIIQGHASHAQAPGWFTTAPIPAIQKLLKKLDWSVEDVDLWEINEAFAVVPMAAMHELNIPREKLNVNGGACALGHPIGASGARIIVTLLNEMERRDVKRGIASLCIGGGEGTAIALERP